jgi:hypothetical protein
MVEGKKYDEGKNMLELIPVELINGIGRVLTYGANKYSPRNWENGIAYGRVFGATLRHLFAWWGGERLDKESGMHHLWHAATELSFLIAYEERCMTQLDDRPASKKVKFIGIDWGLQQAKYEVVAVGGATQVNYVSGQCDPRPNGSGGAA